MGHSPTQQHSFNCGNCSEEISISVIQHPQEAKCTIQCTANGEEGNEEGLIVNLHPDFPIPADQLHKDRVFPWLNHTIELAEKQGALGIEMPEISSIEQLKALASSLQSIPERWKILKKAWSLTQNEKFELAEKELSNYNLPESSGDKDLRSVAFHFCAILLGPANRPLFDEAVALFGDMKRRNPSEFERFRNNFRDRFHRDNLSRYYEIFSEYFRDFGEFSQTLLHVQYGLKIDAREIASSSAFARTKMFYGNAYEALTSNIAFLACLNNLYCGRPYDQFQEMNLDKYLTINKANRANTFLGTAPFAAFAESLDSTLRNASHHGAIKLNKSKATIIYRSGGTGAEKSMRYVEYLTLCNRLMLTLAALLMLELVFMF